MRSPPRAKSRPARSARGPLVATHAAAIPEPGAERLRVRIAIALVALVTIALLGVAFGPHRVGDYFTETDFYGAYAEGARQIQRGVVDASRYGVVGPVYEVVLALVGAVAGDLLLAAELISALSVAGVLWLAFRLARRYADARTGLATLAILAVNPQLFRYGYSATTDALALLLQMGALALLVLGRSPHAALAAGAIAGLAFLTRYNLVVLLPAGILIGALGGAGAGSRRGAALRFTAGFLAPVVPWTLWSLSRGATFSLQLHHNIAYEVFARARGISWDAYQRDLQPQFPSLTDVIARDPGAVAARLARNLVSHAGNSAEFLTGWPVAAAAIAGVALGWRDRTVRRAWPLWLTAVLVYATLVPVFYSERYALALLPMIAFAAGLAFGSPRFAFALRARSGLWLKSAALALVLAASLLASLRLQVHVMNQLPVEVLDAARQIRPLATPGDRVIARKGHFAWHAGFQPLPFPFDTSLAGLARTAREHGARWLYMSWPEAETRPQFFHLLDTTGVVPGLTPRAATAPHPAVVYEIGPGFGAVPEWLANDTLRAFHTLRGRLAVDGNDAGAHLEYAAVLRAMGASLDAMEAAARAEALAPGRPEAPQLLGVIALDAGAAAEAEQHFARALSRAPGHGPAWLGLGWARLERGDAAGAAAAWVRVVDHTADPATLARMIAVFEAAGDAVAADRARARLAAPPAR